MGAQLGGARVAVKKTIFQNLWPRINSNEFISYNRAKRGFKPCRARCFLLRRQLRLFKNVTLVARWREHFHGFLAIFLVAQLPPKRGVLAHKNSLASY